MNERDELVEDFRRFLAANYPCTCEAGTDCDAEREEAEALVKTVEIRGYRKPRTITTAEEANSLKVGSVVRAETGIILEKLSDGWFTPVLDQNYTPNRFWFPATVLWEPM